MAAECRQTQIPSFRMCGDETALPRVSKEKRGARREVKDDAALPDAAGCLK